MDQNVIRTDLLPESMSLWLIAALAAFALAAWAACHWAVKRYGSAGVARTVITCTTRRTKGLWTA